MLKMKIGGHANAGFSLVELMVAMVLGLIVIGAVIALVLSMIRANNQTIAATRLTQELRATAALMEADLRRAGGTGDPLTAATSNGGNPATTYASITIPFGNACIQYAYQGAEGGDFRALSRRGGAVFLDTDVAVAGATCDSGIQLSSPVVKITALTFARRGPCDDVTPDPDGRCIHINLVGELANDSTIRRRYSQDIYVRSVTGVSP